MSSHEQSAGPAAPDAPGSVATQERRGRGRLVLAKVVVEKVAGQVVSEIGATYGTSGGVLGLGSRPDTAAPPKVEVDLADDFVDITVHVGFAYPTSLRRAADEVRRRLTDRVQQLTGVAVRRVDVEVAFLHLSVPHHNSSPNERERLQ